MLVSDIQLGEIMTICIMAVALGLDAFSLGIGIGMKGIRLLDILKISVVIGIFHILMPLMGMFMGQYVSLLLGNVATAPAAVCSLSSARTWCTARFGAKRRFRLTIGRSWD